MTLKTRALRLFLMPLLAGPAVACGLQPDLPSEPPPGLEAAWFHDDCAPWDGPAVSLYLARERGGSPFAPGLPYLRVTLYASSSIGLHEGERLRFEPGTQGDAQYCRSTDDCDGATGVGIEFSGVEREVLEGRLEVLFGERPPIRGAFRAGRMPFQALCG